ncbi:hypothetical protein IMAU60055_01072 [Lactiplantibacillus plantarum]|nr:hypothetical protein [Lactiplantibacillus plantarum]
MALSGFYLILTSLITYCHQRTSWFRPCFLVIPHEHLIGGKSIKNQWLINYRHSCALEIKMADNPERYALQYSFLPTSQSPRRLIRSKKALSKCTYAFRWRLRFVISWKSLFQQRHHSEFSWLLNDLCTRCDSNFEIMWITRC